MFVVKILTQRRPPGTGKSHAALAVAFEIGKAVKVVNCAEILSKVRKF